MKNKEIELFVPGRLCLLGEHSDWAGKYRNNNIKIEKGYAIVTGIEEGIYATVKRADNLHVHYKDKSYDDFSTEMDMDNLYKLAEEGNFWSYVAGVAATVKEQYNVGGIDIEITNVTLPVKKGLSSSAAICVLVARAFNQLYNLHLNTVGEMNLAYLGEISTPSRCGKLDQACAFGKKPILMTFDGDKLGIKPLKVGEDLHFVFADLNAHKDTIKILADLNKSYPFAQSDIDFSVQQGLGPVNKENVFNGIDLIASGNVEKLGNLISHSQETFDKFIAPACPDELTSPVLHKVLEDEYIKSLSYGGKGVGSQGDGTIQFLARDEECQKLIKEYLEKTLGMPAFTLTINKTKPIKKAIIPVAGNGTRMYPYTKIIKKSFLPIVDSDNLIKPSIMVLLEELDEAGIEEICLIIDEADQKEYDDFFKKDLSEEFIAKLSPSMLEYESKIQRIGKKLKYIYQEEKLGFGHAVSLCKNFANGENILLVLGDQLYKTTNNNSCTTQLLNNFSKNNSLTVSVFEIPLEDVSKYGILTGTIENHDDYFVVDKITEKPEQSYAKECLYTKVNNSKKYYSVFGEYILTPTVFKYLDEVIKNGEKDGGEYQLTTALSKALEEEGMIAFIPDGEMLDIGNVESYKKTLMKKMDN